MEKNKLEYLGYIAAFLTAVAFVPQVYNVYKKPEVTKHLSLITTFIYLVGLSLWIVYGLSLSDYPIILSCGFSGVCNLYILVKTILSR